MKKHSAHSLSSDNAPRHDERAISLFKGFPLPAYAWRKTGHDIILVNYSDAAEVVTNGNIRNFINTRLEELYQPGTEVVTDIRQCFTDKSTFTKEMEYTFVTTKKTRHLKVTYSFIEPDMVLAYTEDITQLVVAQKELLFRKNLFHSLIQGISEALVAVDDAGMIVFANQQVAAIFGYSESELIGKEIERLIPEALRSEHVEHRRRYIEQPAARPMGIGLHLTGYRKDGTEIPVEIGLNPVVVDDKIYIIAVISDITVQRELQDRLRRSEELWQFALEGIGQGVWDWHIDTKELFFSPQMKKLIGYDATEPFGSFEQWVDLIHPDDRDEAKAAFNEYLEGKSEAYDREYRIRHTRGEYIWVQDRGKIMEQDAEGRPLRFVGTYIDISERKKAEEELDKAAHTDMLTGLSNRWDFYEKFSMEISRVKRNNRPFALILCDIDHFKHINDTYGHLCGDMVLETIAALFRNSLRKHDLIARWGGEEFIVLLPETTLMQAGGIAEKLRQLVAGELFTYDGVTCAVTMSFGVTGGDPAMNRDEIVSRADACLYEAKNTGRNRVVLDADPGV